MDCPQCHASAAPPARFCSVCGARQTMDDSDSEEQSHESESRFQSCVDHTLHGVFIADEQGQLVEHQSVGRDFTERRQIEESLRLTQFSVDCAAEAIYWIG